MIIKREVSQSERDTENGSLNLMSGIMYYSCVFIGWTGNALMRQFKPETRIRLLRVFAGLLFNIMKSHIGKRLYHSFRGHKEDLNIEPYNHDEGITDDCVDEDVAILFSGGKDSMCAAWLLSRRFRKVHLLTMKMDSAVGVSNCQKSVRWLKQCGGDDKFVHEYVDTEGFFKRIYFEKTQELSKEFGQFVEGAACTPCHVVMESQAIIYCKKKGIHWISFGISPKSRRSFDQNPRRIQMTEEFLKSFGLNLTVPLWERPELDPMNVLISDGVVPTPRIGKPIEYGLYESTQPFCPLGIWYTINNERYIYSKGFDGFLDIASGYRRHLENLSVEFLRDVHGIMPDNTHTYNSGSHTGDD